MFGILADVMRIAARQPEPPKWDAPRHWVLPEEETPKARARDHRDRRLLRRWLRETGLL